MFSSNRRFRSFSPGLSTTKKPEPDPRRYRPLKQGFIAKLPQFDVKLQYRKVFELSLVATLVLFIAGFQAAHDLRTQPKHYETPNLNIEVAEIPQTEQIKRPPPPARPVVPIPSELEDVPDDVTIESTELNLAALPPPPPASQGIDDEDDSRFIPYDEAPEIKGGLAVLLERLEYPVLARKSGIEGTVVINVEVDANGNTLRTEVIKPFEISVGFEEAAINALKQVKWKPAYQRDKPIRVWVSVPVRFRLTT